MNRDEAIYELKNAAWLGTDHSRAKTEEALDMAIKALSQEPKSGKWIETVYHRWRCSVCREKEMSEWDNIHDVRTNFCPDCGADMRGAE